MYRRLREEHADARIMLEHDNPFELLVAGVLRAQTTDVAVNRVLPALMAKYPDAASLGRARAEKLQPLLRAIGMYRQKARHVVALAEIIAREFDGQVPRTVEQLTRLPGVGRKTANVVLGGAFQIANGIAVDTHVQRLSQRLGFSRHKSPEDIERDLMALFPRRDWILLSHVLIFHGRRVCSARAPACDRCVVADACPSAFRAETVGRKRARE
jgi:endonuclease III